MRPLIASVLVPNDRSAGDLLVGVRLLAGRRATTAQLLACAGDGIMVAYT